LASLIADIGDSLQQGGVFDSAIDSFVPRQVQQEMAVSVMDAINYRGKLVVESGTGTGKTYAYLIPVVVSGKKTIISTGTRHLQEQIFNRDLPVVLGVLGADTKAEMLKGRSNYLCRYRHRLNGQQTDLVGKENALSYDVLDSWVVSTRVGDIAEVTELNESSPIWKQVTSTADNCLGGKCPDYSKCFVNQARKRAMEADIVVVNHHLFFSDLTLKTDGFGELLPQHEVVIFDEAHSIPDIASGFFGFSISNYQIYDLLEDIISAEKDEKSGAEFRKPIARIEQKLNVFQGHMSKLGKDSEILETLRNQKFDELLDDFLDRLNELEDPLASASSVGENLARCLARFIQLSGQLFEWRENRDRNHVCWLESGRSLVRFHQTPLNVGDHFGKYLEVPGISWIFTSATLAVGNDFSSFCNKVGLQEMETRKWDSPYDYLNNTLLYVPADMPDPREAGFADSLCRLILDATRASRGRCFCLFTSYSMMNRVFDLVSDAIEWPLFLQGQASKQHLLQRFLEADNAVLFGTASFWEGVDVKGEALSCVIIDKLPFDYPSDPVLKSQLNKCEEQGGKPFMDIQVPDAVIGLKQGAGRLIRSETDKGVLILCDPRVISKSYGKMFLKSLPPMPLTRDFTDVEAFYRG
jgi:ATP-dependent DNA helicase DinG